MRGRHRKIILRLLTAAGSIWVPVCAWAQDTAAAPLPEDDFFVAMAKMLAGLALVLGLLFGAYWLTRRLAPKSVALGGGHMKLLARLGLGPRKFVAMVEVAGKVLVLGVTADRISKLMELDDPRQIEELTKTKPAGFAQVFKRASQDAEDQQ